MKLKIYLPVLAFGLMTTGCNSKKEVAYNSGIHLENLDTTALPGTSFYQYACGGWMKNNPLTDEYSRFGSFDFLAENNREQLHSLITDLAQKDQPNGSIAQKVGGLYNVAMNEEQLNAQGVMPIQDDLTKLSGLSDRQELYTVLAKMQKSGISPYFYLFVNADDKNSTMNITQTYQGGLGMGERDFYLEEEESMKTIRTAYEMHIGKMFLLSGFSEAEASKAQKAVMKIETELAKASRSSVELRDPLANYNKFTLEVLKEEFPSFNWNSYLTEMGLSSIQEILVGQPEALKKACQLMNDLPLEEQIAYLQWNVINSAASYLSDDFVNQNFEFYGKTMTGTQELQPRWKRAVSSVNGALGEAVGQMYVEKHFPAAAKQRMLELVGNLQEALGERIQGLEWMSKETKVKAMEKLATFHVKIGYPDKWKDYSSLTILDDSYWANIKRASEWEYAEMIAKAGKPVDVDEWFMNPQTVNAYYNPTTNEICFPAGILQYPFFDMNADDAFNYGAIGVVIGHEMTHGFDDQGRQYDKDGNLKEWWTNEDAENFNARAQVMIDFFDNIEVAEGVHANGAFTLGENIADHGGLQVSYQAFKNASKKKALESKEGFTPEQRFFLAYANVWAGNIRPEEVLRLTKIDPHSLGKWRVDGALPHINAWYEAFGINENNPLYIEPENRVSIW